MPYSREVAGKGGHADFIKNPDVQVFLEGCDYLRPPSDEEGMAIASQFGSAPLGESQLLPRFVVASDASKADKPINDKLPSTQIGFIKVSHVLIAMDTYAELEDPSSRFVDPFKAAELHRNARPVTFVLPGSNVRYGQVASVRDGFRKAVYDQLSSDKRGGASSLVLAETLMALHQGQLTIDSCPSCNAKASHLVFRRYTDIHNCPGCSAVIYPTDSLRLHEGVSDFGDNTSAMTRMMNALEHLLLASFVIELARQAPELLSDLAFVLDGPLAVFGQPAKLHARVMQLIFEVNESLTSRSLQPLLVMGLQKTGAVMDHAKLLERFLPNGAFRVVDDDYRNSFITGSDSLSGNFGQETYYGQDFLFKTERGRMFNFAIPYPFASKSVPGGYAEFAKQKIELHRYGLLIRRACDLIRHFELDLYDNAIVPIALAHRHASISLVPGGKVLDLLARAGFSSRKAEKPVGS
jgi:hypothetical protein